MLLLGQPASASRSLLRRCFHGVNVPRGRAVGTNSRRNTAPPPSRFRALIRPPCASMMARQIASPSPAPRESGFMPVSTLKPLENPLLFAGFQSWSVIRDFQHRLVPVWPSSNLDWRAGGRVAAGILQQVHEHLFDQHGVHLSHSTSGGSWTLTGRSASVRSSRRRADAIISSRGCHSLLIAGFSGDDN